MIFKIQTRIYEHRNIYEIIEPTEDGSIVYVLMNKNEERGELLNLLTLQDQNNELKHFNFKEYLYAGGVLLMDFFYNKLSRHEQEVVEKYITLTRDEKFYKRFMQDLKKIALKTKIEEKWFKRVANNLL